MSRTPKKKVAATNELLTQLQFVGSVLKDQGTVNETHILLSNGYAVAFNGVISAGIRISSDLYAAPNYALFQAALSRCGEEYNVEPMLLGEFHPDGGITTSLQIKSSKFKAIVPCIDPTLINIANIDPLTVSINDEFKKGLETTAVLASETGQQIYSCSILLNGQFLISTENGVLLFEYWHGCDMPTNIAVPKALATALAKTNKKLVGFGNSETSITFYFEDESWIKSQLFAEKWPNVERILNVQSNPFETPKDLWEGLAAVAPHSVDGLVYFDNGVLRSHASDSVGANYTVSGLPKGPVFNIKQLMFMKDHAKQIDFFAHGPNGDMTYFAGDRCRGVVAGRVK